MPTPYSLPNSAEAFLKEFNHFRQLFTSMRPELEVTLRDTSLGVEGFVVVWNTAICKDGPLYSNKRGMGKGGTRVLPNLQIKDVSRLARSMALKNAAAGLPLGGAKSGLNDDPNSADYEKRYRRFVKMVQEANLLYEDGGIFGGFGYDIGGQPPLNARWACDELGTTRSFTGKPVDLGGTDYDGEGIAGLGVAVAAKTLLAHRTIPLNSITYGVQGVGAMGSAVIRYMTEFGGRLGGVSDPRLGGTWLFNTEPSSEILESFSKTQINRTKQLLATQGATFVGECTEGILTAENDLLFPCALEDSINKHNVHLIKARFICEGANNPTSEDAKEAMFERKIDIIPDVIANPGGIISAYVEMTSTVSVEENITYGKKVIEAKKLTAEKIEENVGRLLSIRETLDISPYEIGEYLAYKNIFKHQ